MSTTSVKVRPQGGGIPGLKWVLALAVVKLVFLVAYSSGFGYMSDELYFLACAQHPALGYADLPPLLSWLTLIVTHTLGTSLMAIRFYPAVASAVTVVLGAWLAAELGGGRRAVLLSAVLVFINPVTFAFGHILSTNALDMPMWMVCVLLMVKIEKGASPKLWLAWGAAAGLVMLHKYTVAFLLVALIPGFLLTSWRRWLANRWFWCGCALLVAMVLPNVIWQATHEFPFLQLQHFNRVYHHNVILSPLAFLGAQLVLNNPLSFVLAICGLVLLFLPSMRGFRALAWTYIMFLLLMFFLHARDYYLAAAYPPLLAAGAVAMERWLPGRWVRRGVYVYVFIAAVFTGLALPSFLPIFPPSGTVKYCNGMFLNRQNPENLEHTALPDWVADQFGWREPVEMVAKYYNSLPPEERTRTAILGNFYGQAGAIDFFGPELGLPKAISGHHSYWLWGSHGYKGESIIVMDAWPNSLKHCASVTLVGKPEIPFARPDEHPAIYHCRGLDFDLSARWEYVRHYD